MREHVFMKRLGVLLTKIFLSLAVFLALTSFSGFSAPNALVAKPDDTIAIMVLIDSSGSMSSADPSDLRLQAVKLLIDLLPDTAHLGIINFDNRQIILRKPEPIIASGSSSRESVKALLVGINPQGGKDINGVLKTCLKVLDDSGYAKPPSVVLLSDGEDNKSITALEEYKQKKIKIHTIGLTSIAGGRILQKISSATAGVHEIARTAEDLGHIYALISTLITEQQVISSFQGTIQQDQVLEKDFPVESGVSNMAAIVSWPGSEIYMELADPSGKVYQADTANRPDGSGTSNTYKIIRVDTPYRGMWKSRLYGAKTDKAMEPFTFEVVASSEVKIEWRISPERPIKGKSISVGYRVIQGNIEWSSADIALVDPSGNRTSHKLSSLNASPFVPLNYAELYVTQKFQAAGLYRVSVMLNGKEKPMGTPLQRTFDRSFVVEENGTQSILPHIPRKPR